MNNFNIKRVSPAYTKNLSKWKLYKASYMGGEDYIDFKYKLVPMLIPHKRELDIKGKYNNRLFRSYYQNYCKHVIDTYAKFIFSGKDEIDRIVDNDNDLSVIEDYIYNIDGRNTNVDDFMEQLFKLSLIYGEAYIFIDKQKAPLKPISELEAKQIGYRAYCKILSPLEVMDYSMDDNGEYRWILIKEEYIENSDPFKDPETVTQYRLITRDKIYVIDDDNKTKEELVNSLGIVPVIKSVLTDIDFDGAGESMLKDIVRINNEIYNISSMITEDIVETCFPLMYGPKIYSDDAVEGEQENIRSTLSYIEVPNDATPPNFIAPPITTLEIKIKYIDGLIMEIMRLAGLQKDDAVTTSSATSGISKAISFLDTNQSFSEKALRIQQIEQKMWDIIKVYDGIKQEITVKYPHDFDVINKIEKNKLLQDLLTITESQTAKKLIYMELFNSNIKASDKDIQQIESELDEVEEAPDTALDVSFNNEDEEDIETIAIKEQELEQ